IVVPAIVVGGGERASKRFADFFASIHNDNTRAAYQGACHTFFHWCEDRDFRDLVDIEPIHVAADLKALGNGKLTKPRNGKPATIEKPTVKQHLTGIRMLFDFLVVGQIVAINPAHAVRGPKHVVKRGKTPVLTGDEARALLDSIDTTTLVGLR